MLKNFVRWFIIFGLSFLVANVFGWAEQEKAFLYIAFTLVLFVYVVAVIKMSLMGSSVVASIGAAFLAELVLAMSYAFTFFIVWAISKLFNVNLYVAYEIITFVSCLFPDKKKN